MKKFWFVFLACLLIGIASHTAAQPTLKKDFSYTLEIPSLITMDSSPAHLYALSDTEGMVVFRTHQDSLQWLYSSTGMEQRGNTVTADVRFAYLFGNSRRLTILEPTSVLGVYSSTMLPAHPRDAKRIGQNLYVALGEKGLGQLSLRTPASVDSTVNFVERSKLSDVFISDLEVSDNQLFVLSRDQKLYLFRDKRDDQNITLEQEFDLSQSLNRIFLVQNTLFGSDSEGNIYEIDNSGNIAELGNIGESVNKIEAWNDWLIIRGNSNRLWTSYQNRSPRLWKDDPEAGNFFTVTKGALWLSEYNQINKISTSDQANSASGSTQSSTVSFSGSLSLKEISNHSIPHSKPLLLPIEFEDEVPGDAVKITYKSNQIDDANIRGRSFYWQPTSNDVGSHEVKLIATTSDGQIDSTKFNIEVKSFNAPPRFAPIRSISIPVGEEFTLPVQATDPDGMNRNLIRFLGVDLPDGASIDETTGEFRWTPTARQTGKNEFRVIATDQYGAAKSIDITINVVENPRSEESGN